MNTDASDMYARSRHAIRRNTEARTAVVNAARARFGLPPDMRTADVLWYVASELSESSAYAAAA